MTRLRAVVMSSCAVALIAGCQQAAPDERADGTLNVTSADPNQGIEAKYTEQGHTLVLRSKSDGAVIRSELIDEQGHDVAQLASGILDHTAARTGTVTVNGLFEHVQTLRAALQLTRHGIRQLGETLPADAAGSPAFTHLSKQAGLVRRALGQTRLALLQEWGSEARSQLNMTPDEHAKFFSILNRQAQSIMATANGPRRGPAAAAAPGETSPDAEIAALLGPERYAQYQTQRKAFFAPAGDQQLEVVP
jgi:hypothetical protein